MDTLGMRRRTLFSDPVAFEQLRATVMKFANGLCASVGVTGETSTASYRKWDSGALGRDPAEANQICLEIIQRHNAHRTMSMVSEEMHLNHFLAEHDVEALETDLGEYIIQLDHETPSHIIVPAIHKNRDQIARLFHDKIPNTPYTEVVEELNAIARKVLRQKFLAGEVGVSGVNFRGG